MMKSRRKAVTSDFATAPSALASFAPSEMMAMEKATDFSGGVAGRLEPIEEPRLIPAAGADPWFLAADPNRIDTVEYA